MTHDRRMVCVLAIAVALVSRARPCVAEQPRATRRFTGAFSGTGRACYGKLFVRTETIAWLTPFSQCPRVRYRIVGAEQSGNARALTFELTHRAKGCRYGVLHLRHRDEPDPAIGWEVFGYATLDDYRQDRARGFKAESPTSMVCYLVADEPRAAP
jgi:hypothetical protein